MPAQVIICGRKSNILGINSPLSIWRAGSVFIDSHERPPDEGLPMLVR